MPPPSKPPAFVTLYDQNVERIYRYHLVRTGCNAEAEDLTAETFRAALESFGRFRPPEGLEPERAAAAWLTGIARHKLADHFRRGSRSQPLETAENQPAPGPSLEEQAGQRLEMARVAAALRAIRPEQAEALALHYFAGLGLAEVGRLMGKSEEAAKKLVQRGLAGLREQLVSMDPFSGREK